MTAKKPKVALFGPDGKVLRKVAAKPAPSPQTITITTAGTGTERDISGDVTEFHLHMSDVLSRYSGFTTKPTSKKKSLRDVSADQIEALTAGFEGMGRPELPAPPRDLETYRDAYASAAANCLHDDATEILYGREWSCEACGRYLNRDDMRRARAKRGPFWGMFG